MDKVFERQFNQMIRHRRALYERMYAESFGLIPFPNWGESRFAGAGSEDYALVGGIKEAFFKGLNSDVVVILQKRAFDKRVLLADGTLKQKRNGETFTVRVDVPDKSVAVVSRVNIHLPKFTYSEESGEKQRHKVSDGFGYVDCYEENGVMHYIYILPERNIRVLALRALVITPNRLRSFVKGYRIMTSYGFPVYIYVVDYKGGIRFSGRVLRIDSVDDWSRYIDELYNFWVITQFAFDRELVSVYVPELNEMRCLAIKELYPTAGVEYESGDSEGDKEESAFSSDISKRGII